jgi:hypothetical protein
MIDAMAATTVSLRVVRSVFFSLLFCVAVVFAFAGCGAPGMKSSGDADGEPVEHKVFYEGWGWKKSE